MKISKKHQLIIFSAAFIILLTVGLIHFRSKITYLERTNFNTSSDTAYRINSAGTVLRQKFSAPYDMISRVSIRIDTGSHINNSQWIISIVDPSDESTVCSKTVNASRIEDDQYYDVKFDNRNYRVRKGDTYELHIRSLNATEDTGLTFYMSDKLVTGKELYSGNILQSGSLCLKLYGGDTDYWWTGFFILIMAWAAFIAFLYFKNGADGIRTVKKNLLLQSMLTAFVSFLLWMTFSVNNTFTDENDNIRAGLEISRGAVLYRDYVTQHTPVASYLCGIFALLGAKSVAQMRLYFYLTGSFIWAFLYHRHAGFFSCRKLVLLPVLEAILIISILQPYGWMILSDGIQGICMVMLALEFIRYLNDGKLTLGRCIVISVSVWGSFGSAFVSAYALALVFILFVIREIRLSAGRKMTFPAFVQRYYRLVLSIVLPFMAAVIYFHANHALRTAFNLTYKFNTDVYSMYEDGFGTKPVQPLINAFQNFFGLIADNVSVVIQASATNTQVIQLILSFAAVAIIVKLFLQRKYYEALLFLFLMCGNATRGYDFHGLAAWYIIIAAAAVHCEILTSFFKKISLPVSGCLAVFMLSIYIGTAGDNLLTDMDPVSEIETAAVEKTESGDKILIDTYTCDSIYLLFKNRYPANRCTYFLPWYMDWYEQQTIEDLEYYKPAVVIYNPDKTVWTDYVGFTPAFLKKVQENYTNGSDNADDWKHSFWVRNDEK